MAAEGEFEPVITIDSLRLVRQHSMQFMEVYGQKPIHRRICGPPVLVDSRCCPAGLGPHDGRRQYLSLASVGGRARRCGEELGGEGWSRADLRHFRRRRPHDAVRRPQAVGRLLVTPAPTPGLFEGRVSAVHAVCALYFWRHRRFDVKTNNIVRTRGSRRYNKDRRLRGSGCYRLFS